MHYRLTLLMAAILTIGTLWTPLTAADTAAIRIGLNTADMPEISLGKRLFFDRRLSANGTLSCGMCHIPEQGFAQNQLRTPVGFEGRTVKRNSPTLLNVASRKVLFHDGREFTLEDQVWSPLLSNREMGNVSIGVVIERLRHLDDYADVFNSIYADGITIVTIGTAIAAYERTLVAVATPFDSWNADKDEDAVNDDVKQGFALFNRHGCGQCHTIESGNRHFTDDQFHNTGIGFERSMKASVRETSIIQLSETISVKSRQTFDSDGLNDLGRYEVTGDPADRWKYRTPTLRNIELTAPYMHDGSLSSLEEVIKFYMHGGIINEGLDERLLPFTLDEKEIKQLVAFLNALTSPSAFTLAIDARKTAIGDHH
ncbi:MAG: cytochrome c peroxidase [Pseudomonadales bacterium]